jgi:O-antigen/teichoic acid export membrane protein
MQLRRNSLINLAGGIIGLILYAALTPLYLHTVGPERYGLLAIVWAFLAFFSAFDFGMGIALGYIIATKSEDSVSEQSQFFWTGLIISLPFGLVAGAVLFGLIGGGLGNLFNLSISVKAELVASGPSLVAIGICTVLLSAIGGLFRGRQMFATTAVFGTVSLVLSILLPVAAAVFISPSLHVLIVATLLSRLMTLICAIALAHIVVLEGARPRVSVAAARVLLDYGAWASLSGIVELAVSGADRFLLGAIAGSAAVTYYAVPSSILSRVLIVPNSLAGAAVPQAACSTEEEELLLARKILRMVGALTPCFIAGMFLAKAFLMLWLGTQFASQAASTLKMLCFAYWIETVSLVLYYRVLGLGRPRINLIAAGVVVLPYIGALYLFVGQWGVLGAAVAYALRNAIYLCARTTLTRSWSMLIHSVGASFALLLVSLLLSMAPFSPILYCSLGLLMTGGSLALVIKTRPSQLDRAFWDLVSFVKRLWRAAFLRNVTGK